MLLGIAIYRGAVKVNLAVFFKWTGAVLILVAAGIFAYGFHDLQEAGVLPGLQHLAFDISHVIPPDSWYGVLLKGIFNFNPAPTVLEAIAWLAYLVPVLMLYFRAGQATTPPAVPAKAPNRSGLIHPSPVQENSCSHPRPAGPLSSASSSAWPR